VFFVVVMGTKNDYFLFLFGGFDFSSYVCGVLK